jgi:deoxyribodipyrimidine photo-lyase
LKKYILKHFMMERLSKSLSTSLGKLSEMVWDHSSVASVNPKRIRAIKTVKDKSHNGPVIYWMSRDCRVRDNWALLRAQELSKSRNSALVVVFCLLPTYADATLRAYDFLLHGLRELEHDLLDLNISFRLLLGEPTDQIPAFASSINASVLVADFCPLRAPTMWKKKVGETLDSSIHFEEVDAHNVIPAWIVSGKLEVGARTLRPKVHNVIHDWLTPFPPMEKAKVALGDDLKSKIVFYDPKIAYPTNTAVIAPLKEIDNRKVTDWSVVSQHLTIDASVPSVSWCEPGERAAKAALELFLSEKLANYGDHRNDPTKTNGTSNLSPYLHFGQLSAQRIVLETAKRMKCSVSTLFKQGDKNSAQSFVEELIVRRELADNWCYYNHQKYDSIEGAAQWAQDTLKVHSKDKRDAVYTRDQFEHSQTHESLWNAAQRELVKRGKLHGFMRMYWAKKILEWSSSPSEALSIALYLNDKYNLDGRDPNGVVGCMWSICGVHDMGWTERNVFGKIRYMNLAGCKRKFDVDRYISMWSAGAASTLKFEPIKK